MSRDGRSPGLTRRVGIVAFGRAASVLSVLAVNFILTRTWPQEEFNLFTIVWVFGNTLVPIFLIGLPTSLLYFFPLAGSMGRRRVVLQAASCLAASGALLALLLFSAGHLTSMVVPLELLGVGTGSPQAWAPLLYPFVPYFFSLVAGGFAESTLVASGRPSQQAMLALVGALGLVAVATGGWLLACTMSQVAFGLSSIGLIRLAVAYTMVARVLGDRRASLDDTSGPADTSLRALISYSIPIAMNDTVGALSRVVDRVVIFFFFPALVGTYHVGAIEVPISLLLAAIVTVLIPEISRLSAAGRVNQIGTLWKQAVGRLSLITIPLFFLLFTHAGLIIAVYLPSEYAQAEWVFRIFLLMLPLRCAIYNPLLVGMGKASWALWGGVGDLVTNITLSIALVYVLMSHWGSEWALVGPAVATVVSTYLQVGVLILLIGRHLRWSLLDLMPWLLLFRTAVFSSGAAAVSLALSHSLEQPALQLFVGFTSFTVVIAAASWMHAGQRQELQRLLSAFRSPSSGRDQ